MPPKALKTTQKQVKSTVPGEAEADAKSNEANSEEGTSDVNQESAILEAIHSLKSDFAVRFDGLLQAINGVQCDLKALTTRVTETEDRIGTQEDNVSELQTQNAKLKTDSPPRAVIMKFLNYADKVRTLKAARAKAIVMLDKRKLMFFPDVSAELHKKRKRFDTVKKDLRDLNILELCYGILHPAILCVTYKGKRHLFDNPPDAQRFLQDLKAANA